MKTAKFLKCAPDATTQNGAETYSSTLSPVVDLFGMGGALRSRTPAAIEETVFLAWLADPVLTLRCLFYIRDAREGVGERNTFRIAINRLCREPAQQSVAQRFFSDPNKVRLIPEYGRWDDLFAMFDTPFESVALEVLGKQFYGDLNALKEDENAEISLVGKWLPSINASKAETRKLAFKVESAFGLKHREYRQALSTLRARLNVLERNMTSGDYSKVSYASVPSLAFIRHLKAFKRRDSKKFSSFIERVKSGEEKINASVLTPAEIVWKAFRRDLGDEADSIWKALPNYLGDVGEQALVVADTSGSMSTNADGMPLAVALSLALYYAERNTGPWQGHFLTFSANPQMVRIRGTGLLEKLIGMSSADWDGSTNVEAAFRLILRIATVNGLSQEDIPKKLYIVSDMEFDDCTQGTNYQNAKRLFADAGYALPTVVFWNVNSMQNNCPVRFDESGTALVSGYSAAIFKGLVGKDDLTPEGLMLDVLNGPRYSAII